MTDIENVVHAILQTEPDIVMVDSIQTMNFAAVSSSSGSVSQVRECTQILARVAKNEEISIFLVGHVNKDGAIAGPKVLEHIVDAVLYFEGERHLSYRILRAVKNRYGSTNEIGVFEMTTEGLEQYLDTFRHGMPPHGGLGIGLERLTMQLIGEDNVRETTLFPRDLSRLEP